jgi:hypothetical protein
LDIFKGSKMPKLIQEVLYFIYTAADYRFSMQYNLVEARFSVPSTPPVGLTHPPVPLVPDGKAVNHLPLSCAKVKERSKLYLYSLFLLGYSVNFAFVYSTALLH